MRMCGVNGSFPIRSEFHIHFVRLEGGKSCIEEEAAGAERLRPSPEAVRAAAGQPRAGRASPESQLSVAPVNSQWPW